MSEQEEVISETTAEDESPDNSDQAVVFIRLSEPARIKNQKDLEAVAELHRLWIEDVLSPKAGAAEGRANFQGVDLRDYILRGLDFRCADFSRAVLDGCDLSYANLSGCNFSGSSLRGADLRGAKIKRADFSGADLTDAHLDKERENLTGFYPEGQEQKRPDFG